MQFEQVDKTLGRRAVLRQLNLEIHEAELLVIMGASGAGKSTVLRLAAGLEPADAGRILMDGNCLDSPRDGVFVAPRHRHMGMVFQDFALWPHMSCLQNVAAAVHDGGREAALELLRRLHIEELACRRPGEISGGQQQRVALARALAAQPRLLLLDEPFSSLDMDTTEILRLEMLRVVREQGMTTLLVSHDPSDAWRMADRIAVLGNGRLLQCETPTALYAQPKSARIARLTGAEGGLESRVEVQNGVTGVRIAEHFVPATAMAVSAGDKCHLYARPEGLHVNGSGGVPCELRHCAFESGIYRAYWSLPDQLHWLCTLEERPPQAHGGMHIDPQHVFLYPLEEEAI
ncbi:MAG: ABC transporter ATP-binding protein [Gammaproteobacteria bacterium]|nr:ABC transporter ATP-binding protein [Gammaproteobacteria bacterium]